jgi:ABC-2 type transport system permease protein
MSGVFAVFYREYRQRMTNFGFIFWDLFAPVAYLLLFGLGFERSMGGGVSAHGTQTGYIEFFLAGVVGMTTFGIAMNTSWGFFMDKDSGIFYELLTYPITRRQLLVGKSLFNVVLSAVASLVMVIVAALTMDISILWSYLPVTTLLIVLGTACWFFFFATLAVRLRRVDSFNTFTSAAYLILMFLSSMFYPLDQVPAWFRWIALMNPMTWQVDALRFSLIGVGSLGPVLLEVAAFLTFTLISLSFAVRAVNRAG